MTMTTQPSLASAPAIAAGEASSPETARRATCPECGSFFVPKSYQQTFCCKEHKAAFQNRAANEGRAIIALAKAWRAGRNVKGSSPEAQALRQTASEALSEMSSILDLFAAQDNAANRPNPLGYAKSLLRQGKFIDRQRS
jgi:hypothetical protein